MSMDYPYYEELRRRGHPAAKWWLAGDRLHYLGLLPTLMAVAGMPPSLGWWLLLDRDEGWVMLVLCAIVLCVGPAAWLLGGHLKRIAHEWGERDGIRPEDWWR